ncbi:MAG: TlpA family protein disulfide reductase [Candidatus Tectomicrobia bacterium]|nr:TlpA family protein disulfide reductase [Candidatus Tectomicrobia bacterium]
MRHRLIIGFPMVIFTTGLSLLLTFMLNSPLYGAEQKDPLSALRVVKFENKIEAPNFSSTNPDGQPISVKDFRGKVVLMNFFATWCTPCLAELPQMDKLYQTYKDKGFVILGVSLDVQGEEVVKPFMKEMGLTFPAVLDSEGKVARLYGLRGLPSSYLIGRQGEAIGLIMGFRDWTSEDAHKMVEFLLKNSQD